MGQSTAKSNHNIQRERVKDNREANESRKLDGITVFTCLLVVVGVIQSWSFIQTQRAFIAVTQFRLAEPSPTNTFATLFIFFKNAGPSAAKDVSVKAEITFY